MTAPEKVAARVGRLCLGAIATALGNATGGGLLAGAALVDMGSASERLHASAQKAILKRTQAEVVSAITTNPDFASVQAERVHALLVNARPALSRADLVAASEAAAGLDVAAALARRIEHSVTFDGDDDATRHAVRLALEAGMRACLTDAALQKELAQAQLLHLVQTSGGTRETVTRLESHSVETDRVVVSRLDGIQAGQLDLVGQVAQVAQGVESMNAALATLRSPPGDLHGTALPTRSPIADDRDESTPLHHELNVLRKLLAKGRVHPVFEELDEIERDRWETTAPAERFRTLLSRVNLRENARQSA